jgi:hypothetical protein
MADNCTFLQVHARQARPTREKELDHSMRMRVVFEAPKDGHCRASKSVIKEEPEGRPEPNDVAVPGVRILQPDVSDEACLAKPSWRGENYIRESERKRSKTAPAVEYDLESDDEKLLLDDSLAGVSELTFEMAMECLETTSFEKMTNSIRVPPPKPDSTQRMSGIDDTSSRSCTTSSLQGLSASCFQTPISAKSRVWEVRRIYVFWPYFEGEFDTAWRRR